jgi:hypothetical protein
MYNKYLAKLLAKLSKRDVTIKEIRKMMKKFDDLKIARTLEEYQSLEYFTYPVDTIRLITAYFHYHEVGKKFSFDQHLDQKVTILIDGLNGLANHRKEVFATYKLPVAALIVSVIAQIVSIIAIIISIKK